MLCVVWTYAVPPQLTRPAIDKLFTEVADRYLGVRGLVREYFGFSGVTARWGAAPVRTDWIVPVVAESAEGRIITA